MNPAEAKALWENVKANHRVLDDCPRHDFSTDCDPDKPLGKHWRCVNCGGRVDAMAKLWYERGIASVPATPSRAEGLQHDLSEAVKLLREVANVAWDVWDAPCAVDSRGMCQTHYSIDDEDGECFGYLVRKFLTAHPAPPEPAPTGETTP